MKKLQVSYAVSERRALSATGFPKSSHRYKSVKDDRADLRVRLRDLASSRVHYGYRRLHVLLQREGWKVNHKLVYRVYKEEGLAMRRKRPRRNRSSQIREGRTSGVLPKISSMCYESLISQYWQGDFNDEEETKAAQS